MNNYPIGTRVMAVLSVKNGIVDLLGEGEYMGDDTEEAKKFVGFPNPTIKLDSGVVVFGCECWWGPVNDLKEKWKGMTYVTVPLEKYRPLIATAGVPATVKVNKEEFKHAWSNSK